MSTTIIVFLFCIRWMTRSSFLHICSATPGMLTQTTSSASIDSNEAILHAMDELGVDHIFANDPDGIKMAPLNDPRWQSVLGKAILADVVKRRTAHLLYASEQSLSEHNLPESSPSPEPDLDRKAMAKAHYQHYANGIPDVITSVLPLTSI
ncbi:hypothetical protein K438DRAFT_1972229 [Mycena galopus ATCC 62051]|nr:hypothetical protein K438DRAFT_1972229 [Mycena galopus ATCC 62051]